MRITDIEIRKISIPFIKPLYWARGKRQGASRIITIVRTDQGITGYGEVHFFDFAETMIKKNVIPIIKGEDPHNIEHIYRKLEGIFIDYQRSMAEAWAPIEMALWDIIGKAAKQPVYKLIGGLYREKIGQAPYIYIEPIDKMVKSAKNYVDQGFKTLSLKIGRSEESDLKIVKAMRDAVGPHVKLRIDPNQTWIPGTAKRLLAIMEQYDLEYVQQPIRENDIVGMMDLRHSVKVPIMADESAFTQYDAMQLIMGRAVDCIMIDPRKTGGIWQAKKTAAIAEAAGIPVSFHNGSELGIATAATLHIAASTPNVLYDIDTHYLLLSDDIISVPFQFENGKLKVPNKPGLGVELDLKKLEKYSSETAFADTFEPERPDWFPESPAY